MAKTPEAPKMKRRQQFAETFKMARRSDPKLIWWLLGAFVIGAAIGFGIFWLLPGSGPIGLISAIIGALMCGILAALVIFSRRAQAAAYAQLEGRPGAAASALTTLRRGWKSEPAIALTKQQDVVHRVVGPPGIVLVGEGNPQRLKTLMAAERRRHERVAADTPIHEVVVGDGEGQVPLPKLTKYVSKLGRQVKPAEMTDVLNRLKAIDAVRPVAPMPKGPVPTSMKGLRGQMRGR
jgi:F0F1-type ATP synthase assembly protein I